MTDPFQFCLDWRVSVGKCLSNFNSQTTTEQSGQSNINTVTCWKMFLNLQQSNHNTTVRTVQHQHCTVSTVQSQQGSFHISHKHHFYPDPWNMFARRGGICKRKIWLNLKAQPTNPAIDSIFAQTLEICLPNAGESARGKYDSILRHSQQIKHITTLS